MEVKRQLDVLDKNLEDRAWLAGDEYTIADMATAPWYGSVVRGEVYEAGEFLSVHEYKNVIRWSDDFFEREAVKRGRRVNRPFGPKEEQVIERHSAADLD